METRYTYDPERRLLSNILTERYANGIATRTYQDISYSFDPIGNVTGYVNDAGTYRTAQSYQYDSLYQLRAANGESVYNPYQLARPEYAASYAQTFDFDAIGNMTNKTSDASVNPSITLGANLDYTLGYAYYSGYSHRVERAGDMYYKYDGNGNLLTERQGGHAPVTPNTATLFQDEGVYHTDYGFGLATKDPSTGNVYQRDYVWNERNLLIKTSDPAVTVDYRYGADGQRAIKYNRATGTENMYFNTFWQTRNDGEDIKQSKNIYVGETRIATKCNYQEQSQSNYQYELANTFWYHTDHLGSAQLVTDSHAEEYERIEYTPYGELWIEKTQNGMEKLPFRFTGKEYDEETGLYYYGARYLDPKTGRWLSTDPALGEYVPAPGKGADGLPGMGGMYNSVNLQLYHYAGNNPVKYTDPDGRILLADDLVILLVIGICVIVISAAASSQIATNYYYVDTDYYRWMPPTIDGDNKIKDSTTTKTIPVPVPTPEKKPDQKTNPVPFPAEPITKTQKERDKGRRSVANIVMQVQINGSSKTVASTGGVPAPAETGVTKAQAISSNEILISDLNIYSPGLANSKEFHEALNKMNQKIRNSRGVPDGKNVYQVNFEYRGVKYRIDLDSYGGQGRNLSE